MTLEGALVALCCVGVYTASVAIDIESPSGVRLSPAAAFGPALVAVAVGMSTPVPGVPLVLAALAVQFGVVALFRRQPLIALGHAAGLLLVLVLISAFGGSHDGPNYRSVGFLLITALGSLAYFVVNVIFETAKMPRSRPRRAALTENVRVAKPAIVILASTSVLIVMVFSRLSWATFLITFVPMLAIRHEFSRYGEARRTYDETVRSLAALAEGAGYVPGGHLERVSKLCASIGRELAMPVERVHKLQLIGLLHDVGAVALADPSDVAAAHPTEIATNTGQLLAETEYLSEYAGVVLDVARGHTDLPLEGRILRLADTYDAMSGPLGAKLRDLRTSFPEDAELIAALETVIRRG